MLSITKDVPLCSEQCCTSSVVKAGYFLSSPEDPETRNQGSPNSKQNRQDPELDKKLRLRRTTLVPVVKKTMTAGPIGIYAVSR